MGRILHYYINTYLHTMYRHVTNECKTLLKCKTDHRLPTTSHQLIEILLIHHSLYFNHFITHKNTGKTVFERKSREKKKINLIKLSAESSILTFYCPYVNTG